MKANSERYRWNDPRLLARSVRWKSAGLKCLQPFEKSARQLCLHYFSACGEIPGLKVFVTASGTVEQDTCSIIVDCRLKSPDKVEKIYSFFNKTRLRHWWVCLLQTKKHNVQSLTIHMCRPTYVLHFLATYNKVYTLFI